MSKETSGKGFFPIPEAFGSLDAQDIMAGIFGGDAKHKKSPASGSKGTPSVPKAPAARAHGGH
jgi:hypothetical protein